MKKRRNLLVDVSAHGLGHLAQVAPLIARLKAASSDLHVTVRSAYSPALLEQFIGSDLHYAPLPPEPTLEMYGPLSVNKDATEAAFRRFHDAWEQNVKARAEIMSEFEPDLLVSDIPYVSLAAAERLALPAVALCCYNWRDARRFFTKTDDRIEEQIERAYQSACVFLQTRPHMPMEYLSNRRSIGPLARIGARRGAELRRLLDVPPGQKLVLVTFGGSPGDHSFRLPRDADIFWIVRDASQIDAPRAANLGDLPMPFIDVLASVDAVVSKEGYGTLAEAACNGVRLLMLTRQDWPETPFFVAWAKEHVQFSELPLDCGVEEFRQALEFLLSRPPAPAVEPSGIAEAADVIAALICT
jgi:hypothetical protein